MARVYSEMNRRLCNFVMARHPENVEGVWAFPRITGILENKLIIFSDRRWLEIYRVPKRIFQQLVNSMQGLQSAATRMRKPVPVNVIVAMLLKRLGKGLDYREIGDKFGYGAASTACKKVNEAICLLIKTKTHTQSSSRWQESRS